MLEQNSGDVFDISTAISQAGLLTSKESGFSPETALAGIEMMESELQERGIYVRFNVEGLPEFPYSEKDLQIARAEGEFLLVRPSGEIVINGESSKLTFKAATLILSPILPIRLPPSASEKLKGVLFDRSNPRLEIELRWALVRQHPLPDSMNLNYSGQEGIIMNYAKSLGLKGGSITGARRRTLTEAYYDTAFFFITQGFLPLGGIGDLTSTQLGFDRTRLSLRSPENEWEDPSLILNSHAAGSYSSILGVYTTR